MTLSEALADFLYDREVRGLSKKTLVNYREVLTAFIRFVEDKSVEDLTQDAIKDYIAALFARNLSKATIASYIRHIKVFLTWIAEEYEIPVKYRIKRIITPRVNKKTVYMYSDSEIKLIFSLVSAESEWLVARNKACISLMLDSGLRQAEACGVKTDYYDKEKKHLTVCGKGGKYRIVPVGKLSEYFITQYILRCPFEIGEYLFLDRRGNPMTTNALKQLMHKIAVQVPFEFSCHKLRHNFATNYCLDMYEKKGFMDAYSLQILLGHSDMETTMRYIHHASQIVASKARISHLDAMLDNGDFEL